MRALYISAVVAFIVGAGTSYIFLAAHASHASHRGTASVMQRVGHRISLPVSDAAGPGHRRPPAIPALSAEQKVNLLSSYYADVNAGQLADAYGLLSPGFHAYQSYDQFNASYGNTVRMELKGERDYPGQPAMGVALLDAERTSDGTVVNAYVGYVKFAYDPGAQQWFIDERHLTKVASENLLTPPPAEYNASDTENPAPSAAANDVPANEPNPSPTDNCVQTSVTEIDAAPTYVVISSGDRYDVVNANNKDINWTTGDDVTLCASGGVYTLTKGEDIISVVPHD